MGAKLDTLEIRTPRLALRPMGLADEETLFALFAHWPVVRWLSTPPWPYRREHAGRYIRSQLKGDLAKRTFAILLDGALIGGIDVRMNRPGCSQRGAGPNLGYWLGERYWGRGYMTEAARGFIAHVLASGIGDTLYSGAFVENASSLRVQQKLGFVEVGETMLHSNPRDGEFPHINTELARERFVACAV